MHFSKRVVDPEKTEKKIHKILESHGLRAKKTREFFMITPEQAWLYFDLVPEYTADGITTWPANPLSSPEPKRKPRKKEEAEPGAVKRSSKKTGAVISSTASSATSSVTNTVISSATNIVRSTTNSASSVIECSIENDEMIARLAQNDEIAISSARDPTRDPARDPAVILPTDIYSILSTVEIPTIHHLSTYEANLLIATAFERKLLRLIVHSVPYAISELRTVNRALMVGSVFELVDANGAIITRTRVDDAIDRLMRDEVITLRVRRG